MQMTDKIESYFNSDLKIKSRLLVLGCVWSWWRNDNQMLIATRRKLDFY